MRSVVAEAAQRALSEGSAPAKAAAQLGGWRGFTALIDGYLSLRHRDHPESGCAVACVAADVARAGGSARSTYTHQVQEYLAVLADLIDNPDRRSENAKRSSPSVSWSARSPSPEQSTTLTCPNRY